MQRETSGFSIIEASYRKGQHFLSTGCMLRTAQFERDELGETRG